MELDLDRKQSRRSMGLFLTLVIIGLVVASPAQASDWTLAKQENGIDVYTRPVEGSGIKEFKGTAEFDTTVESVLEVLRDSDRFKTWFPNTPSSKLLAVEGPIRYQYSTMGTPWPISNRDNVLRTETRVDETTGVVDITVTAAPDYYPEQKDLVRVRKAKGTWRLEPLPSDRARVTFIMHLDPGGGIPEWMINARIIATPFEALTNLRVSAKTDVAPPTPSRN